MEETRLGMTSEPLLDVPQKIELAVGIAKGMRYLHEVHEPKVG